MDISAELRKEINSLEKAESLDIAQLERIQELSYKSGNPAASDIMLAQLPKLRAIKAPV